MYEIVKVINGYEITRMVGTRGYYSVTIWKRNEWEKKHDFRTIKAATAFCKTLSPKA